MKNKKRLILVSILFTIPLFTSCIPIPNKSSYEDGFQKGYDTGFEAGYNEGITSNDTNKNTTHSKTNESTSNFESGSWNDETFNNYWLNLSFKNPSCSTIATVEEFNSLLGFGAEVSAERNNKNIDAFKKAAEYKIVPGFLTVDAFTNSNVSLLYENLELSVGGSQRTEEDYANIVFETLKNNNTLISQNFV